MMLNDRPQGPLPLAGSAQSSVRAKSRPIASKKTSFAPFLHHNSPGDHGSPHKVSTSLVHPRSPVKSPHYSHHHVRPPVTIGPTPHPAKSTIQVKPATLP